MSCHRCPHHVRHGQMTKDGKTLQFKDLCGLKLKRLQDHEGLQKKPKGRGRQGADARFKKPLATKNTECIHHPFPRSFDYFNCMVYQKTFSTSGLRNNVIPTKDIHYSETISNVSVTDLEFL